jgi:hypothetical protein
MSDFFFLGAGSRLKEHMPKVHSKSVPAGQTMIAFRVTGSR